MAIKTQRAWFARYYRAASDGETGDDGQQTVRAGIWRAYRDAVRAAQQTDADP